jgi:hypothetical protein
LEIGVLQYHLDRLAKDGLAEITFVNHLHGHIYWAHTSAGSSQRQAGLSQLRFDLAQSQTAKADKFSLPDI